MQSDHMAIWWWMFNCFGKKHTHWEHTEHSTQHTADTFLFGRDKICYCDFVCLPAHHHVLDEDNNQQIYNTKILYICALHEPYLTSLVVMLDDVGWWWLRLIAAAHIRINFIVIHHIMRGWEMAQIDTIKIFHLTCLHKQLQLNQIFHARHLIISIHGQFPQCVCVFCAILMLCGRFLVQNLHNERREKKKASDRRKARSNAKLNAWM